MLLLVLLCCFLLLVSLLVVWVFVLFVLVLLQLVGDVVLRFAWLSLRLHDECSTSSPEATGEIIGGRRASSDGQKSKAGTAGTGGRRASAEGQKSKADAAGTAGTGGR